MTDDLWNQWETWARRHIGGGEAQVRAAAEAAVQASQQGATSEEAAEAAKSAARGVAPSSSYADRENVGYQQPRYRRRTVSPGVQVVVALLALLVVGCIGYRLLADSGFPGGW